MHHRYDHRGFHIPVCPGILLFGIAQLSRDAGQALHLQHQERGQVCRFNEPAVGRKDGAVVPAGVAALGICGDAVAVLVPVVHPPGSPLLQEAVSRPQCLFVQVVPVHDLTEAPAVDRRLGHAPDDPHAGVEHIQQRAAFVLFPDSYPASVVQWIRKKCTDSAVLHE